MLKKNRAIRHRKGGGAHEGEKKSQEVGDYKG